MKKPGEIEVLARGVCVKSGRLLLCHTKGAQNTYLPGGHVEFMEAAPDSLSREVKEELGLDAEIKGFLGAVEHTFLQRGKRHCEINLVFEIEVRGIDPSAPPDSLEDYIDFRWISPGDLAESGLEPAVLRKVLPLWICPADYKDRWASSLKE